MVSPAGIPSPAVSFVARAGASTSPAGAISTVAATGSQTEHSRTVGAISRPHSGQIQWNMHPIYTQNLFIRFGHTPYPHYPRNLKPVGIPSETKTRKLPEPPAGAATSAPRK